MRNKKMKKTVSSIRQKWYLYLTGVLLLLQAAVFLVFRGESYIQVHDNLDLFMAHYEMLKKAGLWFAHGKDAPILHGITRDLFGSEFILYNFFYILLPGVWAYLAGYAAKIAIGIFSFILLAKDVYKEKYDRYRPLIICIAAAFGLIPVFPAYGIAFTSVPLIVWLLRRLYFAGTFRKRLPYYAGVFFYPVLSYFSYHGFFILCYMCAAVIILWIKDKRFPKSTFASVVVLSLGYMAIEYRLFKAMLFDSTVTIRTTMAHGEISFGEALRTAFSEFVNASFHSEDAHTYIIFWVVLAAVILINAGYIRRREAARILKDPVNLVFLWMIFNVLIFGFYQFAPFRELFERLVPPLTGFEFARTAFFNTFLWYAELLLVCVRMYDYADRADCIGCADRAGQTDHADPAALQPAKAGNRADSKGGRLKICANVIAALSLLAVMFAPQVYNDFYNTCYNHAYKILLKKDTSTVNYNEFYSVPLFEKIMDDISYDGEWSAAYGMHPAVLNYNGIATVDGYLGMYSQAYKDEWGKVIAPALEGSPFFKSYYDSWGARCYLYSGSDENTYAHQRIMDPEDKRLMADTDELRNLGCRYIFSRVEFSNADDRRITLIGTYTDENSPYTIWVYEL